jgi:hypothetical protein
MFQYSKNDLQIILPLSQNVRRLRITQKLAFLKFDQIYTQRYKKL